MVQIRCTKTTPYHSAQEHLILLISTHTEHNLPCIHQQLSVCICIRIFSAASLQTMKSNFGLYCIYLNRSNASHQHEIKTIIQSGFLTKTSNPRIPLLFKLVSKVQKQSINSQLDLVLEKLPTQDKNWRGERSKATVGALV